MWDDFNFTKSTFKDHETKHLCNAWVATAIVGTGIVSAIVSSDAADSAADAQTRAGQQAAGVSKAMYDQTRKDLSPYREAGEAATTELQQRLPHLTSDIDVTDLLNDPNSTPAKAYNFTLTQGNKAVQNSAAARGLGVSGAALKGAAAFTTGLADNTYTNLFNLENTNRTNAYTRLKGLVDTGQNAAAQTGVQGTALATQQGNALIGTGNAQAAAENAKGAAVSKLATDIGGYAAYKGLYGNNNYSYAPTTAQEQYWASGNVGPV